MRKLLLISTVVLLMFAGIAPASAAPNGPPDGFILQDTDAAYADFVGPGGCNVFVGYVRTDRLKEFGVPGGFHPHSDLQVKLTGTCAAEGTVDTLTSSLAGIVELDSADVNGIAVTLDDGSVATVTLTWTAEGEIIKWKASAPGINARHQTRLADLTGTVVITGPSALTVDQDDARDGPGELDAPRITFYDEIQLRP